MTVVVRIQVHHLNLEDATTIDRLADFDNATFEQVDALAFITVYVEEGQSVVATVLEATRKLANKIRGAVAMRAHPDLVTTSDIASRVGVSREAVRKWIKGSRKPFPIHFDTVSSDQRVWRWVEVVEWLRDAKAIDMDEDLPSLADIAHIDACLNKVPDATSHAWLLTSQRSEFKFEFSATGRPAIVASVTDLSDYRADSRRIGRLTRAV
jgi:hypothetical protein